MPVEALLARSFEAQELLKAREDGDSKEEDDA